MPDTLFTFKRSGQVECKAASIVGKVARDNLRRAILSDPSQTLLADYVEIPTGRNGNSGRALQLLARRNDRHFAGGGKANDGMGVIKERVKGAIGRKGEAGRTTQSLVSHKGMCLAIRRDLHNAGYIRIARIENTFAIEAQTRGKCQLRVLDEGTDFPLRRDPDDIAAIVRHIDIILLIEDKGVGMMNQPARSEDFQFAVGRNFDHGAAVENGDKDVSMRVDGQSQIIDEPFIVGGKQPDGSIRSDASDTIVGAYIESLSVHRATEKKQSSESQKESAGSPGAILFDWNRSLYSYDKGTDLMRPRPQAVDGFAHCDEKCGTSVTYPINWEKPWCKRG